MGGGDVGLAIAKDQKQRPGQPPGSPLLSRDLSSAAWGRGTIAFDGEHSCAACGRRDRIATIPTVSRAASRLLLVVHTDSGGSGSKRVVDVERTAASNLPWCLQTAVVERLQLAASGRLRLLATRHEAG